MALIKCPECGHHISDKAKECPKCGCPIGPREALEDSMPNGVKVSHKRSGALLIAVSLLVLFSITGLIWFNNNSHHQEEDSVRPDSISTIDETITPTTYGYIDKDSLIYNCGLGKEFLAYSKEQMDNYKVFKLNIDEQIKGFWDKFYQKEAHNEFLTEGIWEAELNSTKKKELEYQNKLREFEERINKNIALRRNMLNDAIQKYAMRFAQSNKFEALFIKEDTLWRNMIINPDCKVAAIDVVMNPQYDVTIDFANFLNEHYSN